MQEIPLSIIVVGLIFVVSTAAMVYKMHKDGELRDFLELMGVILVTIVPLISLLFLIFLVFYWLNSMAAGR